MYLEGLRRTLFYVTEEDRVWIEMYAIYVKEGNIVCIEKNAILRHRVY